MDNILKGDRLILHVATDGCDSWSGLLAQRGIDLDGPLASISGARNVISAMRKAGELHCPVEVLIHKGIYQIKETIKFKMEDLGCERTPVTYCAAGDGEVIITGGLLLKGFEHHENGVFKLDLNSAGYSGDGFNQFFNNGVRQIKARYPKFNTANPYGAGWLYVEGPIVNMSEDGLGQKDRFICHDPILKTWTNIEEIELFIYARYNWTNDIIRLKSYNQETGEIVLQQPCAYEIYPGDRFYFRNVKEELNAPSEWCLDKEENMLYFYPKGAIDEDSIISISLVENLIEISGTQKPKENIYIEKIDWIDSGGDIGNSPNFSQASIGFIKFQGLTMEGCDGAAALIQGVKSCAIIGCTIRNTGAVGVGVLRGANCRVNDCDIYETGSHGIYISGGIRSPFNGLLENSGNEAVNNYIHHIGVSCKSVAGVAVNGVGIRVAHNYIHDSPRWGILSRGTDNILEYNHIRHVNIETSDTAAIYLVDRDLSMRGTKIRFNHIHDILGYHCVNGVWHSPAYAFGIYLDDWTSGVEIKGNLTYRTPSGGMYIHAGQDNVVENNMFLETTGELLFLRRWEKEKEYQHLGTHGVGLRRNKVSKNILASRKESACLYRIDNSNDDDNKLDIKGNIIEQNLIWRYELPVKVQISGPSNYSEEISYDEWRANGFDNKSIIGDPLFVDIEKDDFRLNENSPAFEIGFEALPLEKMGPYKSNCRASWPIIDIDGAREYPLTLVKK